MAPSSLDTQVRRIGLAAGLDAIGVAPAAPFESTRQVLEDRRAAGLNGTMQFTYRNPARSTDPERTLPGVRSLVVGARSYRRERPTRPTGRGPVASVARYMWGDDRDVLLRALGAVADELEAHGHRACVVSDQNHLVDREAAHRAGLGWYGKSANLLLPGHGSWFLLGSVLTDALLEPAERPVPDGCGTCERCLDACPTGAIVAPGVVDARRCLSWTLQQRGVFPREQRVVLGDRIYGCDDCQEVCPPNRRETRVNEPRATGDPDDAWVPVLELLDADDDAVLDRHGGWWIADRDPRYLRRNALLVLGNVGDGDAPAVVAALRRFLSDADPLLRTHAAWAARRLGRDDLLDVVADDPDPDVRAELAAPPPPRRAA